MLVTIRLLCLSAGCLSLIGLVAADDGPAPARLPDRGYEVFAFVSSDSDPCQRMLPTLEKLNAIKIPQASNTGMQLVEIVYYESRPDLARKWNITAVPMYVAVNHHGEVIGRKTGWTTENELRQFSEMPFVEKPAPGRPVRIAPPVPELPGAVSIEPLLRVTYRVPGEKATAFLMFLDEHATVDYEATLGDGTLMMTASPEVHAAIGPFLTDVLAAPASTPVSGG